MHPMMHTNNVQVKSEIMSLLLCQPEPSKLGPMDGISALWDEVRARIEEALERKGWSRRHLATEAGFHPNTLAAFLRGHQATLGSDKIKAMESLVGPILPGNIQTYPAKGQRLRLIPVVDLRKVRTLGRETHSSGGVSVEQIHRAAEDWVETDRADPGLFAVAITSDCWDRFRSGDRVLVSPETKPRPGGFVAAQVGDEIFLCRFLSEGDEPAALVELPDHTICRDFRIVGSAVEHRSTLI